MIPPRYRDSVTSASPLGVLLQVLQSPQTYDSALMEEVWFTWRLNKKGRLVAAARDRITLPPYDPATSSSLTRVPSHALKGNGLPQRSVSSLVESSIICSPYSGQERVISITKTSQLNFPSFLGDREKLLRAIDCTDLRDSLWDETRITL